MDRAALERALITVPFSSYDQRKRRYVLPTSTTDADADADTDTDTKFACFFSAVLKGDTRSNSPSISKAWKSLSSTQRQRIRCEFPTSCLSSNRDAGNRTSCDRSKKDEEEPMPVWKRLKEEVISKVRREMPGRRHCVIGLSLCPKRCTLLAFHSFLLRTIGSAEYCGGVSLRTIFSLQRIVDSDRSPFPLSLIALFTKDRAAVRAIRDYRLFWKGRKCQKEVLGKWNRQFWTSRPDELVLVTVVVQRYCKLKSQRIAYMPLAVPKHLAAERCNCPAKVRFCKQCMKTITYPDIRNVPSGRSVLLDVNSKKIVCQTCNSTRITRIALFEKFNDSVTMSIGHPDRHPVRVCNSNASCLNVTSNLDGDCGRCR